jgi:tetratricopeptide (TPR) repeat protein
VFSKEGEFWRVGFENDSFTLRHSKGLSYLAQLLRFPGREFHALDLIHGIGRDSDDTLLPPGSSLPRGEDALAAAGLHIGDLGNAGEMLDDQAKTQYRRRLEELRDELEEAKGLGDVAHAEQVEAEIDALTAELSRAVGLGGRNRKAASVSERARQSVTHAIKSALDRIEENHRELGAVLSRRISTGTFCSYYPDPAARLIWEFGTSGTKHRADDPDPAIAEHAASGAQSLDLIRPPTIAASARNRTEVVGREAELARLWNAAQAALVGHGSFVLVGGGPGVGKTRLSLEFLAQASRRGFACLNGRCYERDEPHPMMPFVEVIEGVLAQASSVEQFRTMAADDAAELARIAPALRRVFPELLAPAELPTQQQRRRLFQGLFDFIARISRNQPLLLLVDDIHWADESTLAMLNFLARRVEHVPVLVVANYRDEGLDATRPLNRTLEELIRLGIDPIKLAGLPRESVTEMLASLSRRQPPDHLVTLIFEETQGNPFFVEEVFNHLVEEGKLYDEAGDFREISGSDDLTVPQTIRLVLGRRLDRLSEEAREVLSAASVIGRSFNFVLLETVLDRMDPDALFDGLEEAERTGFITSSSQGPEAPFAFSHELVRQTLLAGISLPRQQRLHLKIALAMEKVFAARIEEHAAELAYHLVKSGPYIDAGKAMSYLSLTGQILLRAGALEDARLTLAKALQYQPPDPVMHARTLADLAGAERGLGDWNAATSHLQEAIGLYSGAGDLRSVGRIVFEMVESLAWTGRFDAAAEIAERGLNHLRSKDEDAYRYRLLAALGYIQAASGAVEAARRAFDEVVASPAASPFLARVLAYRSVCSSNFLQLGAALEDSRRSVELSNPQSSPWTHALALSVEMRALYQMGKPDQALKIAIELEPLARSVGQLAALTFCTSIRAWAEFGRWPDLALLRRRIFDDLTLNRGASLSLFIAQSLAQMSLVEFLAGNWDSAKSLAEEACTRELHRTFAGFGPSMLLRLAGYLGERDRALELADQTRPRLPIPQMANTIGAWLLLIGTVEGLAMVGERGRAAELYPLVRELLESGVRCMSWEIRFPETVAGIAAGAAGDWERAEEHFLAARKQALELPHRVEEAEVRRFHAMMLIDRAASGDRETARRLLGEAVAIYWRIGMHRHVELTRKLRDQSA